MLFVLPGRVWAHSEKMTSPMGACVGHRVQSLVQGELRHSFSARLEQAWLQGLVLL